MWLDKTASICQVKTTGDGMAREASLLSRSGLSFLVRCPQCQIVAEQLHNESRILVGVLGHVIELGDSILKRRAGHLASLVGIIQDLVLENGETECQSQADWMSDGEILFGDIMSFLVCRPRALSRLAFCVAVREFSDISVVVGLHLLVEDLRLPVACFTDEIAIQEAEDSVTYLLELSFDLLAIFFRPTS